MTNLEYYEKLIAEFPEVQRKGKANPYTSLNGHMFSFLDKENKLSLRFSKEVQANFMEKFNTSLSVQHGSVMNGYAIVPQELLENTPLLKEYFSQSLDFIKSLKPKPTKAKK